MIPEVVPRVTDDACPISDTSAVSSPITTFSTVSDSLFRSFMFNSRKPKTNVVPTFDYVLMDIALSGYENLAVMQKRVNSRVALLKGIDRFMELLKVSGLMPWVSSVGQTSPS